MRIKAVIRDRTASWLTYKKRPNRSVTTVKMLKWLQWHHAHLGNYLVRIKKKKCCHGNVATMGLNAQWPCHSAKLKEITVTLAFRREYNHPVTKQHQTPRFEALTGCCCCCCYAKFLPNDLETVTRYCADGGARGTFRVMFLEYNKPWFAFLFSFIQIMKSSQAVQCLFKLRSSIWVRANLTQIQGIIDIWLNPQNVLRKQLQSIFLFCTRNRLLFC